MLCFPILVPARFQIFQLLKRGFFSPFDLSSCQLTADQTRHIQAIHLSFRHSWRLWLFRQREVAHGMHRQCPGGAQYYPYSIYNKAQSFVLGGSCFKQTSIRSLKVGFALLRISPSDWLKLFILLILQYSPCILYVHYKIQINRKKRLYSIATKILKGKYVVF